MNALFGPFHDDVARLKADMERSGWMKGVVAESAQSEGDDSTEEVGNGDQGTVVQL